MVEEIKCEVCGKTFKTSQALAGHMQGPCGSRSTETLPGTVKETRTAAKTGSLDAAIEKLQVPVVPEEYNGYARIYWEGFNRGVNYGATTILVGIRSAQELSSLGISQATPIIKMAQEMRQAEGQAAQDLANQVGQISMQGNQQVLAALNNLAATQTGAPNPMEQMIAEAMKPVFNQLIQTAMGGVLSGFQRTQQSAKNQRNISNNSSAVSQQPEDRPEQNISDQESWSPMGEMPDNVTIITEEDDIDV